MNFSSRNKAQRASRWLSGENLLRLIAVLSILLPAGLFAVASALSYRAHFDDARERLDARADLAYQQARGVFATFDLVASQTEEVLIYNDDTAIAARDADLSARLARLGNRLPEVEAIWILDANGHPLLTSAMTPAPRALDFSKSPFFTAHKDPHVGTYVSQRDARAIEPSRALQLSYRRRAVNDAFVGVIGITGDPQAFERFYEAMLGDDVSVMSLVHIDGAVLARVPTTDAALQIPPGSPFMRARKSSPQRGNFSDVSAIDGVERLVAYRTLEPVPVYVIAALDTSLVVQKWRAAMAPHLYFGLPASLALFIVSLGAMRQARRRAGMLEALQREGERRAFAEEALRQANKMEAIGRLTGGVAHDFNNLLQVMLGRLAQIQKAADRQIAPAQRDTDALQFAIDRAATLTHRLLAFSRQQPLRVDVVDVNRLITGMIELVRQTAGNEIVVETVFVTEVWPVSIDANQLENAILNLTSNARDAMGGAGRITIETANANLDEAYAAEHVDAQPGDYVSVSLTDTGHGISHEMIGKIFEPFFTTKPIGQGTGLGLSMVYGFVRQSGGHIAVASQEGQGTVVRLYLPRDLGKRAQPVSADPRAPGTDVPGNGVVLVVEDEAEVRRLIVDTLTETGYTTLSAADAHDGLCLLDAHPEVLLLLTDVGLPDGMNGRQLADVARARRPDLKVVFMTGFAPHAIVPHGRIDPGIDLLSKPFTRNSLTKKIRELLERADASA
ncbi:MAG: Blue-light-activated protein [Hyphomicrobiales bacterium]|nr:Blue-light-activated protein [Hyphomicrobiales bacterium]